MMAKTIKPAKTNFYQLNANVIAEMELRGWDSKNIQTRVVYFQTMMLASKKEVNKYAAWLTKRNWESQYVKSVQLVLRAAVVSESKKTS
jgi:hypothetical protein